MSIHPSVDQCPRQSGLKLAGQHGPGSTPHLHIVHVFLHVQTAKLCTGKEKYETAVE